MRHMLSARFSISIGLFTWKNVKILLHLIKHSCSHHDHFFKLGALWRQSTSLRVVASKSNFKSSLFAAFQLTFEPVDLFPILDRVVRHVQNLHWRHCTIKMTDQAVVVSQSLGRKSPSTPLPFRVRQTCRYCCMTPTAPPEYQECPQDPEMPAKAVICNNDARMTLAHTAHLDLIPCKRPAKRVTP
jgi:hypothetical protein